MVEDRLPPGRFSTVEECLDWALERFEQADLFYGHGFDNAYDEALYLILHALELPWDSDDSVLRRPLDDAERRRVHRLLTRRIEQRVPAAYLTGEAWFAGWRFLVDERVLVPRSPIAELIDNGFQPWLGRREVHRILDLCTGSGCIGLACAHRFEKAQVDLADLSDDALAVARQNLALHGLEERVRLLRSDVFDNLAGERYDLIVSNPPYVDARDFAAMPEEYRAEPALGLRAGDDGLAVVDRILRSAAEHLTDNGLLVVEVGNSWEALEQRYRLPFTWVEFEHGGHGVFVLNRQELAI